MKILVTAGPTREFIDPVRYITNRSTGKMGYAVASAAVELGHEVCLISGPVHLDPPPASRIVNVVTADEMLKAVDETVDWCDALIMTAAVADWTPENVSGDKIKKGGDSLTLKLKPTMDILKSLKGRKGARCFIGFAADGSDLLNEARRKLSEKQLDAIVANDISRLDAGFEADTNQVTIIEDSGSEQELPLMSKSDVAFEIIRLAEKKIR